MLVGLREVPPSGPLVMRVLVASPPGTGLQSHLSPAVVDFQGDHRLFEGHFTLNFLDIIGCISLLTTDEVRIRGYLSSPPLAQMENSCHFRDSVQVLQGLATPKEHFPRLAGTSTAFTSRCGPRGPCRNISSPHSEYS